MLRKAFSLITGITLQPAAAPVSTHRQTSLEREYIRRESRIGATLFGAIPAGHQRDFFCLDARTWIWFEEWANPDTQMTERMYVRYEFQPRGVLKTVDGVAKGYVVGKELTRLLQAMKTYHDRVAADVYGYAPAV